MIAAYRVIAQNVNKLFFCSVDEFIKDKYFDGNVYSYF